MPAVFLDHPRMVLTLNGSKIACSGVGVEVKSAAGLEVNNSDFLGQDEPVVFDGGGDITLENNRWIRPTEVLERMGYPVVIYSPRAIQWMIARIVERHFDR